MRKWLAASVALAPLCMAHGAWAETVISNLQTTPVATATAHSGAPDDVRVDTTGSVQIKSGAALTLNSNNNLTVQGNVTMATAADGATGILVNGGNTGTVTNAGTILLDDGYAATDTNNDGLLDGKIADGTGRYGIHLVGPGSLTGDIVNSGGVTVDGNNSFGIAVNAPIVGNLASTGSVAIRGDHSIGIASTAPISGQVTVKTISVLGAGSSAVSLAGDVGGKILFNGGITGTGYRTTTHLTRTAQATIVTADAVPGTAGHMLQDGPLVLIAGNVGKGVVFDSPPATSTTNTDVDGDGHLDSGQTAASLTQSGSAPALQIGSATQAITLGQVGTGTEVTTNLLPADYAYGLINKGVITSNGVFFGNSAMAIDVGAGNMGVTVQGGIRNQGSISALAYDANAYALVLESGATTPTIVNSGSISAASRSGTASQAGAVIIDPGASVTTLVNKGIISAALVGPNGTAVAIGDFGGHLSEIDNSGSITASIAPDANDPDTLPNDEVQFQPVAINAVANTTGLLIKQTQAPTPAGSTTAPPAPVMIGNIFLGSGADTLDVEAGAVTGAIFFGNGADQLIVKGGSVVTGRMNDADGSLVMDVANGTVELRNVSQTSSDPTHPVYQVDPLNLTSLHVGATSQFTTVLDPTHPTTAVVNATGPVVFDAGGKLGIRFASLLPVSALTTPLTFTVIHTGGALTGTPVLDNLSTAVPYLYQATERNDAAHGNILVDVRQRSAADAGMIKSEAAAYAPIYTALSNDAGIRDAFLSQTDRAGFFKLYSQLLPDHAGAPLLSLASGVDATSRALADRRPNADPGEVTGWMQEIDFYADKKKADSYGFRSNGFGVASGIEKGTGAGAFGASLAFTSSDMKTPTAQNDENLTAKLVELGLYWRASGDHWRTWARAAGGYAMLNSTREFFAQAAGIDRKAQANWTGYTGSAGFGAAYEANFGRYFLRPEASFEYFYLSENSRTESGGQAMCPDPAHAGSTIPCGDSFDLIIGPRKGHMATAKVMLSLGGKFGDGGWLQPELRIGYRDNISSDPGVTLAQFKSGGSQFALGADSLTGGGPVLGFRILASGGMGFLALEGDAELMDLYSRYSLMIRAGYRF